MIISPQNNAINVPVTKNGPKGTSDFKVFLPEIISPTPIIAPKKKAENKATRILGKPKIKPIKMANLKSPRPIQRPLESKIIAKKKNAGKIPNPKSQILNKSQLPKFQISNNWYKKAIPIAEYITLSGII